jgi:alcohol dehydrogenase
MLFTINIDDQRSKSRIEFVRAFVLNQRPPAPGTLPETLQMADVPEPVSRSRDVLVRVLASTINIDDIHIAEGTFFGGIPIGRNPRPGRPVTPGSDLAGIVAAVGKKVRSISVGDAVLGVQLPFRARGAWAEFCAVDERWVTKKPERVPFGTAAACGLSGLVAISAIDALRIQAGLRIVIVGATGGIGAIAVQLAARAGAIVIGVCGPANVKRACSLGCSLVLDYSRGPWDHLLSGQQEPAFDRVLDVVGGDDTEQMARRILRRDGVFVTVVGPERFVGDRALGWHGVLALLARVGCRVAASCVRGPRYILTGPGPGGGGALADVAKAAANGIVPPIDSTVPFDLQAVREALRRVAAHRNNGRIVIQVGKEN